VEDYLRFDPSEDVVVSLELAAHLLSNLDVSPNLRWKWVIVATHDALQGAMAFALSARQITGALTNKSKKDWIALLETNGGDYPELKIDGFTALLNRVCDPKILGEHLVLDCGQRKDLSRLHDYRNDFAHFKPESWSIAFHDLPRMVLVAVEATDHLMRHRAAFLSEDQGPRLREALKTIRSEIDH
jgi:hypothetical protein